MNALNELFTLKEQEQFFNAETLHRRNVNRNKIVDTKTIAKDLEKDIRVFY